MRQALQSWRWWLRHSTASICELPWVQIEMAVAASMLNTARTITNSVKVKAALALGTFAPPVSTRIFVALIFCDFSKRNHPVEPLPHGGSQIGQGCLVAINRHCA